MLRRSLPAFNFAAKKASMASSISALPEVVQRNNFIKKLSTNDDLNRFIQPHHQSLVALRNSDPKEYTTEKARIVTDAALLTFSLHVESRIASMVGEGFYTIGPCGEELTSVLGVLLASTDPMALHYRHVSANIARQMKNGEDLDTITLNRARGYCVSRNDPVTGGVHCALGGGSHDFIVTSTLASQAPPAVGRAIGGVLANHLEVPSPFPKDFVSFFSLGDGSVNNGHYLSASNLAEFAAFRGTKVPLLTCITDNGISISLRTHDYLKKQFAKKIQQPIFFAKGDDVANLWSVSKQAIDYCRLKGRPATLIVTGITRRFGHAATDRQNAYMDPKEILNRAETDVLLDLCSQMVQSGVYTVPEIVDRFAVLQKSVEQAFEKASLEPKLTSREELVTRVAAPLSQMPKASLHAQETPGSFVSTATYGVTGASAQVMRKHMLKVFDELLEENRNLVYIGEDVRHGGYYLVTEGLKKKYNSRIIDFPPDETSIIGAGMGMSHSGLLPIVEMPYAKYLDCGFDMFAEAAIMNWVSNGTQPNGMVVRLQGFGRGVFGGNFHTHNMLHIPPGVDVVCYSNGAHYAQGMRYAVQQARGGRMVMSVDATELLNLRQLGADMSWEFAYTDPKSHITFDDVFLYKGGDKRLLVVTYGNGVIGALQAQMELRLKGVEISVLDCPLLSAVPKGLRAAVKDYERVLFADVCKEGASPLASHLTQLLNESAFSEARNVRCISAPRTYNPLGNILTFLNKEDILLKAEEMLSK